MCDLTGPNCPLMRATMPFGVLSCTSIVLTLVSTLVYAAGSSTASRTRSSGAATSVLSWTINNSVDLQRDFHRARPLGPAGSLEGPPPLGQGQAVREPGRVWDRPLGEQFQRPVQVTCTTAVRADHLDLLVVGQGSLQARRPTDADPDHP